MNRIMFIIIIISIGIGFLLFNPTKENHVNIKKFKSLDNNLHVKKVPIKKIPEKIPEKIKEEILFHANLMGEMSCEGCSRKLKVYEFCYKGIKYFTIDGGYMAPVMKVSTNPMIFFETCD